MLEKFRPIIGRPIPLGRQGEHLARRIDFGDILEAFNETYGAGICELRYQRNSDASAYVPAVVDTSEGCVWRPTNIDTAKAGRGRVELRYLVAGRLVKSRVFDTDVTPSLYVDGESPEEHEYYDGAYVITPMWSEQVLNTDDKICTDDIHVKEIQESITDNSAGGLTLSL